MAETLARIDAEIAQALVEIERDLAETLAQWASTSYPETDSAMAALNLDSGFTDRNRIGKARRAGQMAGGAGSIDAD